LGRPAGTKGYKYKDRKQIAGPCKRAVVKPGNLLKASCSGSQLTFSLNEGSQGSLAIKLTTGSTISSCASFGGEIVKDTQAIPGSGKAALFHAKRALAPPTCPVP